MKVDAGMDWNCFVTPCIGSHVQFDADVKLLTSASFGADVGGGLDAPSVKHRTRALRKTGQWSPERLNSVSIHTNLRGEELSLPSH